MSVRRTSFAVYCMLLSALLIVPTMLGGNRPMAWAASAALAGLLGTYFSASQIFHPYEGAVRGKIPSTIIVLFWTMAAWMVVQVLPIASLVGYASAGFPLGDISVDSISLARPESLYALMRWLTCGLVIYVVAHFSIRPGRAELLIQTVAHVAALQALYGILALKEWNDTILFMQKWAYHGVATGTFVNRNSFATFLAVGAVACLALLLKRSESSRTTRSGPTAVGLLAVDPIKVISAAELVIILAAIVQSASRMGFLAVGTGLVIVTVLMFRSVRRSFQQLLVLAIGALVALWLYGNQLGDRVLSSSPLDDSRFELYRQVWQMIQGRPLLGYGGGSFQTVFPLFHKPELNPDLVWDKAHSTYFALFCEYGLVFGSLPIIIFGFLAVLFLRQWYRRSRDDIAVVTAIATIGLIGVHSLLDFSMEIHGVALLVSVVIGAGLGRLLCENSSRVA